MKKNIKDCCLCKTVCLQFFFCPLSQSFNFFLTLFTPYNIRINDWTMDICCDIHNLCDYRCNRTPCRDRTICFRTSRRQPCPTSWATTWTDPSTSWSANQIPTFTRRPPIRMQEEPSKPQRPISSKQKHKKPWPYVCRVQITGASQFSCSPSNEM